ncbi:hypothetical protein TNCV_1767371 [Trichonephila clavipes]|nr:hypothetical protein TNCV_1767371 [Trichonephila clavipes]
MHCSKHMRTGTLFRSYVRDSKLRSGLALRDASGKITRRYCTTQVPLLNMSSVALELAFMIRQPRGYDYEH